MVLFGVRNCVDMQWCPLSAYQQRIAFADKNVRNAFSAYLEDKTEYSVISDYMEAPNNN